MSVLVIGGVFREVLVGPEGRVVRLAGSALYAAAAAARLDASVAILAPVGLQDLDVVEQLASAAGLHGHFVSTEGASGTFGYEKTAVGEERPVGYRPPDCRPEETSVAAVLGDLQTEIVLVFGHPDWDPCSSPAVADVIRGTTLLFDRQGWMSATRSYAAALNLAPARSVALMNFGEAIDEFGRDDALSLPLAPGYDATAIKDGPWGVHLIAGAAHSAIAAYRTEIHSEVGSGDVFAGVLAAEISQGSELPAAATRAAAGAAAAIAEPEPLPGSGFAASVEALVDRAVFRPILTPSQRADARLVIEHPQGVLGRSFASRTAQTLSDLGFVATRLVPRHIAEPTLRLGSEATPLIENGHEVATLDLIDWLAARLGSR